MLSTIANMDSFRSAGNEGAAAVQPSDTVESDSNEAGEVNLGEQEEAQRRSPSNNNNGSQQQQQQHHHCTNNAVKKDDLDREAGINVARIDNRQPGVGPPPVKPKPPTATKPVPHNLPNYERGAGRGGPSAGNR